MLIISKCINLSVQEAEKIGRRINNTVITNITTASGTDYLERQVEELSIQKLYADNKYRNNN